MTQKCEAEPLRLQGWWQSAASRRLHFFKDGTPMCGKTPVTFETFKYWKKPETLNAGKCSACRKAIGPESPKRERRSFPLYQEMREKLTFGLYQSGGIVVVEADISWTEVGGEVLGTLSVCDDYWKELPKILHVIESLSDCRSMSEAIGILQKSGYKDQRNRS